MSYTSFDNDAVMGQTAPSLASLVLVTEDKKEMMPVEGDVYVIVFWGQFHKPGYKFLPLYSALAEEHKVKVVAVSVDPEVSYPTKFIQDPAGKYSKVFKTTIPVAWDEKLVVKSAYVKLQEKGMSVPHAYVVDASGKIVWHQNHSQIGATAPDNMDKMNAAVKAVLAGEPVPKVGEKEVVVADASSSSMEEGNEGPDMDDLF